MKNPNSFYVRSKSIKFHFITLAALPITLIASPVLAERIPIHDPSFQSRYIDPCPNSYRFTGDSWCSNQAQRFVAKQACQKFGFPDVDSWNVYEPGHNSLFSNWKLIEQYENGQPRKWWSDMDGRARIGTLVCIR